MAIVNDGQHDRQDWPMNGTVSNAAGDYVDARYYNYMANKPGDEAEQNPIPEDLCPVCGKGNSELFMAGHEDDGTEVWGSRGISHIDCAWQLHTEMYRPQPYYYDQWKAEKQRADEAEANLAKYKDRASRAELTLTDYGPSGHNVTNQVHQYALDKLREALLALEKWKWIATHEVCTEVVDTSGHEVPTIEEREEWELSQLMDASEDR